MNEKLYYEYRSLVREIYNQEINCSGSLSEEIMSIRDQNTDIESVDCRVANHFIVFNISDKCKDVANLKINIINQILSILSNYISNNLNIINKENDTDFKSFISSTCNIADVYSVGNEIRVML